MKQIFGTDGVRGIVNKELTPKLVLELCMSLGTFIDGGTVAIGRDTRISGEMFKNAAISGLLSTGCKVVDLGIAPTPAINYYVRDETDAGIIITASHNPKEYNGLKFIAGDGIGFSREKERKIEEIYAGKKFRNAEWDRTGALSTDDAIQRYKDGIKKLVNVEKIRKRNFKVVVDTGCGAGGVVTPSLLREFGCTVITLNAQLDGTFPKRPPEPTSEVLGDLITLVKRSGADLGVAHDGDADRVVFVDENGSFVSEDVLLAICAKDALQKRKGVFVTPVSSSLCVKDVVEQCDGELVWTPIGSIHVARKMIELGAVFGGEGNGGLIFPKHQYSRDGAMAVAKILEMICEKKMSQLVEEIPSYYNVKKKMKVIDKKGVMERVLDNLKSNIDTTDGVKIWYDDGWVLIRASGTEPIIRIYAESKSKERANELAKDGIDLIKQVS
ncbi:phosphoglucosamine mutase [Halobacteriota archaeon]